MLNACSGQCLDANKLPEISGVNQLSNGLRKGENQVKVEPPISNHCPIVIQ